MSQIKSIVFSTSWLTKRDLAVLAPPRVMDLLRAFFLTSAGNDIYGTTYKINHFQTWQSQKSRNKGKGLKYMVWAKSWKNMAAQKLQMQEETTCWITIWCSRRSQPHHCGEGRRPRAARHYVVSAYIFSFCPAIPFQFLAREPAWDGLGKGEQAGSWKTALNSGSPDRVV
jgi:hypothetical protein